MPERRDLANALRALSMDAVQKAKSGHPGMPMGMADIAEVLWNDFLNHDPKNPTWPNRDRFVVSNGHGSMLLYALLHLTGYDVSIADLKQFRQLHSKTPGHPEYGDTPGVEVTTGPLGQGIGAAVGMALGERLLANEFNQPGHEVIDHYTYCFTGDGCLMEGISHEVCSLAGTLGLDRLVVFWDDNQISIDGPVAPWFNEDTCGRFESYGWHVIRDIDGHDSQAIYQAITEARKIQGKPIFIQCKTTIGYGAPNLAGTAKCHGAPLGEEEVAKARAQLGWTAAPFEIPANIAKAWDAVSAGAKKEQAWQKQWQQYQEKFPTRAKALRLRWHNEFPSDFLDVLSRHLEDSLQSKNMATRKASQVTLNALAGSVPGLIGGSADLSCSNLTTYQSSVPIMPHELKGNYLYYGVREFGMAAIMNGLSLYGGFIPYGGTFLTFIDYAKNALRMSALMRQRVIYVLTHDSIGLGEDGPTHQPIEHLNMLRAMPNVSLWRPCDATETAIAWQQALENKHGPTCLILSRQTVRQLEHTVEQLSLIQKGGYIVHDVAQPELCIIATGSEVELAMDVSQLLDEEGHAVRVVSMPSTNQFLAQEQKYQDFVLPPNVKRVVIEAGSTSYWSRFVGTDGAVIGIDQFGLSAPAEQLFQHFGFTPTQVVEKIKTVLAHDPVTL